MIEEVKTTLPIKDAYKFGATHSLAAEVEKIRQMEIEWDRSYTTSVRRGYVVELFEQHGILGQFKNEIWPLGNSPAGAALVRRFLRIKEEYEKFLQTGLGDDSADIPEIEEAQEQAFAFESHLRDFLEKNLSSIEKGLRIHDVDGVRGVEFAIDGGAGRIDLLAIDKNERLVVIELKLTKGRNKALGQLLYYMGWVDEYLSKSPSRGIIIAQDIPNDLVLAAKRVPDVSLYKYNMSFSISPAS